MRTAGLILVLAASCAAEIVDRIAVSVDKLVITESQISEEIRVTAFLNHAQPVFSAAEKKAAAERLVDQVLIQRVMEISRYPIPDLSAADVGEKAIVESVGGETPFRKALGDCGIDETDLKRHLWAQVSTLRFIDYRFRPAVQVTDTELRDDYEKQVAEWKQRGVRKIPSFEDSRDAVAKVALERLIDRALDSWIAETRKQAAIVYHKDAFQ